MSGFIGLIELGSIEGNQLAAGKSYHDTVASPCMAGMINGASFENFVLVAGVLLVGACALETESGAS